MREGAHGNTVPTLRKRSRNNDNAPSRCINWLDRLAMVRRNSIASA